MNVLLGDVAPVVPTNDFPMTVEPLLQFTREPSLDLPGHGIEFQSSHEIKPLELSVLQPVIRLSDQEQPEVWGIASERIAVKSRRCHTCNRAGNSVDVERRTDHGWIEAEVLLPRVIVHHRYAGGAG